MYLCITPNKFETGANKPSSNTSPETTNEIMTIF